MSRALRVLLTGGIGSGKSTVALLFAERGVPVLDADVIARQLCAAGTPITEAILARYADRVLDAEGGIDRSRLAELVFADPAERAWLEGLLHPAVYAELEASMAAWPHGGYGIACIPLLLETGQASRGDRVLVVDVPESLQVERACRRDGRPEESVRAIMAAQFPRQQRLALADDVIDNTGGLSMLRPQVEALHRRYLAAAAGLVSRAAKYARSVTE